MEFYQSSMELKIPMEFHQISMELKDPMELHQSFMEFHQSSMEFHQSSMELYEFHHFHDILSNSIKMLTRENALV